MDGADQHARHHEKEDDKKRSERMFADKSQQPNTAAARTIAAMV
jgi:hypothetical protein